MSKKCPWCEAKMDVKDVHVGGSATTVSMECPECKCQVSIVIYIPEKETGGAS